MRFPLVPLGLFGAAILLAVIGQWEFAGVILLAALLGALYCAGKWAFWPRHELPRHRVRHQRIRLYLRLHPGRGHATLFELWKHWSARASAEKDRYAR